jgi:hypothetical protein
LTGIALAVNPCHEPSMPGEGQRIADLDAGHAVEVTTSALWLALYALGDDRRHLVSGPHTGWAYERRRWTVDAGGSFALVADAE